jgi:hypothetical protein
LTRRQTTVCVPAGLSSERLVVLLMERERTTEAHDCPACHRIVAEVCGENLVQQSWFRIARRAELCPVHRPR